MNNIKKPSIMPLILLVIAVVLAGLGIAGYYFVKNLSIESIIKSDVVRDLVVDNLGEDGKELFDALPTFLGYTRPYTYLLVFQNNTELRPGGGFIGSYAVIRAEQGDIQIVKVEGTEVLDAGAPDDWKMTPPEPITEYLGLTTWYFRDSNWSPDFVVNSERALQFYTGEGGQAAEHIDAVISITPTVLERLLALTGPIEVQGIKFTADNVTETLEYEVEYGYYDKDIEAAERKQILRPLTLALLEKLQANIFTNWQKYIEVFKGLADERHIMVYSKDEAIERIINDNKWSGVVRQVEGDYLMWVDANLAALKTDHAMVRTLNYSIEPREDGRILATVTMKYEHTGGFDWRTTRYRSYARIFVPRGSELVSVGGFANDSIDQVDSGIELNKQWFGNFISIEPGETRTASFSYLLPKELSDKIRENSNYSLYVQKQSGTLGHGLSVDLNFAKNIISASPESQIDEEADKPANVYEFQTDLRLDKIFSVNLKAE